MYETGVAGYKQKGFVFASTFQGRAIVEEKGSMISRNLFKAISYRTYRLWTKVNVHHK